MNNAQQTARVGLFFVLGLALTWVTFATLSGGSIFKSKGYQLVAGFESLKELKTGDEVRMAGVTIGSVDHIRLDLAHRRAEAVLLIDPGVQIAGDATASIVMAGLIGTNYIGIDLGTAGAASLAPGAEIHTKVTPDINTSARSSRAPSARSAPPSVVTASSPGFSRSSTRSSRKTAKRSPPP
jgi:phospholipid/cholesterol/gamma-HCH transport system substrate-binding protein